MHYIYIVLNFKNINPLHIWDDSTLALSIMYIKFSPIPIQLHSFYNILQTNLKYPWRQLSEYFLYFQIINISISIRQCMSPDVALLNSPTQREYDRPIHKNSKCAYQCDTYTTSRSTKVWIVRLAFFFHWLSHYHTIEAFINYLFINL